MAKKELASTPKKKGSVAIKVVNIIFWTILVLMVLTFALILMGFTIPAFRNFLTNLSFAQQFNGWFVNGVHNILAKNLGLTFPRRGLTISETAYLYAGIWACYNFVLAWGMYLPFVITSKNKTRGVKNTWRNVLCIISFLIGALVFFSFALYPYHNYFGPYVSRYYDYIDQWIALFEADGPMSWFCIPKYISNAFLCSGVFITLCYFILNLILLLPAGHKKRMHKVTSTTIVDSNALNATGELNIPQVSPLATPELKVEKLAPTVRELAILNSLEPFEPSPVTNLPGLYDTDIEKLVSLLEPNITKEIASEDKLVEPTKEEKHAVVLPGIDEYGASPWDESTETSKEMVKEESIKEDVTQVAAPEIIPVPVEEKVEQVQTPYIFADNSHYDKLPPFTNDILTSHTEENRTAYQSIIMDNHHKQTSAPKYTKDNLWIIGTYTEPVKETEPTTPTKPVASVKQVDLKNVVIPTAPANKAKISPIAPITPVTPASTETTKEAEKATPILAPITGPLHSIEKSQHEKIQVVEARKVAFSLKRYNIRTYSGDLTPEEAFKRGVTKVQPIAMPIFSNQDKENIWNQKKHNEEFRKNEYGSVTQVVQLDGNVTHKPTAATNTRKITSIRDMVKAKKENANNENIVAKEKTNIAKPSAPISFKPVSPLKVEEKKEDNVPTTQVKPVAVKPVTPPTTFNKNSAHPTIKPVDPFKKK